MNHFPLCLNLVHHLIASSPAIIQHLHLHLVHTEKNFFVNTIVVVEMISICIPQNHCLSHHQKIEHDDQLLSSRNATGMVKVVDQLAWDLLLRIITINARRHSPLKFYHHLK